MMHEEQEVEIESLQLAKAKIISEICIIADKIKDQDLRNMCHDAALVLLNSLHTEKQASLHIFEGTKQ
jgi:hypothetical protein